MRELRQILPRVISQHLAFEIVKKAKMEPRRGIRLCLALRREEPSCYGCEDDDYKADDQAPANSGKQLAGFNF